MPDSDNTDLRSGNPDTDHYDRVFALAHAHGFTMGTSAPDKTGRYVHSLSMIHGPFVLYGV